ncbi:copper-binding protein [Acidovorax sp. SUPP2522]|uniref:copper-binding protein n=1 Tax=unclassified Acidovorax TaxID=2684926 RepID=UPI00234A39A1|nr:MULTISPECIES: copper-binding protein [unclassified Acidovorax]WCM99403.1 copper-binding protein [Acidovorax sp. GBBC 1281]GKT16248.1 copper-binding protein [Acidovorax sp. SUPP2522]
MTRRPSTPGRAALSPFIAFIASIAFFALAGVAPAQASSHGQAGHDGHAGHTAAAAAPSDAASTTDTATAVDAELSQGEVVRWDPSAARLTLRHGELKNLAMPPMTMVFRLQDPAPDLPLAPGTPVRFHAESQRGALVITRIEAAR